MKNNPSIRNNITFWLLACVLAGLVTGCGESKQDVLPPAASEPAAAGAPATPAATASAPASVERTGGGTIKGHVRLNGTLPGNAVIRMGVDPKCAESNKGRKVIQETVAAAADGSLANVFVRIEGKFPGTTAPANPATIEQRDCIYIPRVVGVQVGQELKVSTSDALLHNVHDVTKVNPEFNVAQVVPGASNSFKMEKEEIMLRLGCDVHRWMTAWVGVVSNPFFAVSDAKGEFHIDHVPAGTYMIHTWQERYGDISKSVKITEGGSTTVDFEYTGKESPPAAD